MKNAGARYVNIDQAAEIAGVCRRTIYNWLKTGRVTFVRTPSGSIRIDPDTLFRTEQPDAGAKS